MLSINTNLSSLIAQGSMKSSTNKLNQAIERMTTGFKINHAKDNAANYAISTNMTTGIGSLEVAEDNASMGLDLIDTASDNLSLIQDRVQRLRDLQEQANNGTYGAESLGAINAECNALVDEINRLYLGSEYNGINLFLETTTDAGGKAQILQEVIADSSTKFLDLGITSGSFSIVDSSGSTEESYDIEENDSIEDMLQTIRSHGLSATIDRGTISISSIDGKYVTGDLMTALGVNTQASTFVDSTEQTSTVEVTYTTSTTTPGYTYTTGVAQTSGVLDYTVTTTTTSTETSSFISDITRRDTRYMTALSSVDPAVDLADGTYKISTAAELAQLATMTNAGLISAGDEFVLANDIDLSGYSNWTPIGNSTNNFTGNFDGNGFVLSGLTTTRSENHQSLFGYASGSVLKNVGIVNISITNAVNSVGGIVGEGEGITIDNVYTNGSVQSTGINIGGVAGYIRSSVVKNTYTRCNVQNDSPNTSFCGGLLGAAYFTTVKSCYSTGNVVASSTCVGGIAGFVVGTTTIEDSYSESQITTWHGYTGGFIGYLGDGTDKGTLRISNSYFSGGAGSLSGIFIGAHRSDTYNIKDSWYISTAASVAVVNASGGTVANVNSYVSGSEPFAISNNATLTNKLLDTTTVTATESTALSTLGLAQDGTIKVVTKATNTAVTGSTSTIAVSSSTTLGELVTALQGAGLTTSFSAGRLSISASDLIYLDSISSVLGSEIGIGSGSGTSWNATTIAPVTNTFTHTLSNTTTMGELGLNSSKTITVLSNGTSSSFTLGKNTTFAQLKQSLQNKGLTVGLNDGIVTLSADSDVYLSSNTLSDMLKLGSVNKVEGATHKNLPSDELGYTIDLIEQLGNIYAPGKIDLQVGIAADSNSSLNVQLAFSLSGYEQFRKIGLDGVDYLSQLDEMLEVLNERQVKFGAVQNRLESVLDEITIKRDNLVSSRSTIRDADIAEVSSHYIQQQILQQASATLLATANQSPSIALQLI